MSFEFSVKVILFLDAVLRISCRSYTGIRSEKSHVDLRSWSKSRGISEKIMEQVEKSQAAYVIFDEVISNPTNEIVEKATAAAKTAEWMFYSNRGSSSIDLLKQ